MLCEAKRTILGASPPVYCVASVKCALAPVADPGFPRGGDANSPGGRQHTILPNFPKNCMKLKEFGPPGGAPSLMPRLDPSLPSLPYTLASLSYMGLFTGKCRIFLKSHTFFITITSNCRQICHPCQPMSLIVPIIVGGVNEQNSIVNKCPCGWLLDSRNADNC